MSCTKPSCVRSGLGCSSKGTTLLCLSLSTVRRPLVRVDVLASSSDAVDPIDESRTNVSRRQTHVR